MIMLNYYGIQYIYKQNINTKILSPDQYKNQILKVTIKDIKSIIKEVFDFNKCMIAYSNKEKGLQVSFNPGV